MGWKLDNPLHSLTSDDQNQTAIGTWEGENLGGITEDNNRLPPPIVGLMILTIITAFLITFPLWGQRPTAAIYEEYIALMDKPEVQALATDAEKMKYIVDTVKSSGSKWAALQERHPLEMDDLRMIKAQVVELQNKGERLDEYTILGDKVVMANFEGNMITDNHGKQRRERVQPWWDKGYTIDIFFIIIFCAGAFIVIKRLPPNTYKPDHTKSH